MNRHSDTVLPVQDMIFAMDIGTRTVIGIVGVPENKMLRVIDIEIAEHDERSVVDGQIEDIGKVAQVVQSVKDRLEKRLNVVFKNVCVAAAGRTLRTQRACCTFSVDPSKSFDTQTVLSLEAGAVDEAKKLISASVAETDSNLSYSLAGYSVHRYYLDGYPMKTLIGHRGSTAKAEIIAAFLPDEVVESLVEAMQRTGLRVASLTLEPIAAMNAVIPEELRLLNLALVDIGAGTSDIAISDEGCISAYDMATVAGDEITEAIAKEFLLDFYTAERIKYELSKDVEEIRYQNILGLEYSVTPEKVKTAIRPAVENLARVIADKILSINGHAPAAVFLVGGGSRTPGFADILAGLLGMEREKIAVGSGNYMKRNILSCLPVDGPEFATPIGIAITSALNLGEDGHFVYVNGTRTRLLSRNLNTVMDALLLSGYRQEDIIGRNGSSLSFTVNGRRRSIRGGIAKPAEILLNGKPAAASTLINRGDRIEFAPAVSGKDALCTVREVIRQAGEHYVLYNDEKVPVRLSARINGKQARLKDIIKENDEILLYVSSTLADVCASLGFDPDHCILKLNGAERDKKTVVSHGDTVDFLPVFDFAPDAPVPVQDRVSQEENDLNLSEYQANMHEPSADLNCNDESSQTGELNIYVNGELYTLLKRNDGNPHLFLDLIGMLDIDTSNPQGKIVLRINGNDASYLEQLSEGDKVDIYWENIYADEGQPEPEKGTVGLYSNTPWL